MRKYGVIYKSVLIENIHYAANITMGFVSYIIMIYIFINLWNYMYDNPNELIAGYSKAQMIWYVMITETAWFGSRTATVSWQTSSDIRSGNIAYHINKPYHYALYIMAKYTGEWGIRLPMYAALAACMGVMFVGPLTDFNFGVFLAGSISLVLGITINAVFKLSISLISFWIEDSNPFQWLYDKMILMVGVIFPIEIFPAFLQPIIRFTPIYTVCYAPAKLFVDFGMDKFVELIMAQLIYLASGFMLMFFIYRKGAKKLYVNGG